MKNILMKNILILLLFLISSISFASTKLTKYYMGTVQVSSLNGEIPYGPATQKLVKREVKSDQSSIIETIYERKGIVIITDLIRINETLSYSVSDKESTFDGIIVFENNKLNSWSYNINVIIPEEGKISGKRPNLGAVILEDGSLHIKKFWNDQVLISENYKEISFLEFKKELILFK